MRTSIGIVMIFGLIWKSDAFRRYSPCSPAVKPHLIVPSEVFTCLNGEKDINRSYFCDGDRDCSDGSDEAYCEVGTCPPSMTKCSRSRRCIPDAWLCDGKADCSLKEDESNCFTNVPGPSDPKIRKTTDYLLKLGDLNFGNGKWGPLVHKLAAAFYLADFVTFNSMENRVKMANELTIHLLSLLAKNQIQDISSSDLASYVNALLVTCLDPKNFHGFNLIRELRTRVDSRNYTNPYVLLVLCNAGDRITDNDEMKLNRTFWNTKREISTGTKALVVMALSCARNQSDSKVDMEMMKEMTMEIKRQQSMNGTVENLHTTALVMQALYAAEEDEDPDNFDESKALNYILNSQNDSGLFGSLIQTYYVLPVLNCRSLVNISSSHCPVPHKDEDTAIYDLINLHGVKMRVQYSLWIGMQRNIERTLTMKVPVNTSIYGIMELASQIDSKYKFDFVVKNRKPYITGVAGIIDDYEGEQFWTLYMVQNGEPVFLQKSPADVMPKDGDHFVLWYRKETWED